MVNTKSNYSNFNELLVLENIINIKNNDDRGNSISNETLLEIFASYVYLNNREYKYNESYLKDKISGFFDDIKQYTKHIYFRDVLIEYLNTIDYKGVECELLIVINETWELSYSKLKWKVNICENPDFSSAKMNEIYVKCHFRIADSHLSNYMVSKRVYNPSDLVEDYEFLEFIKENGFLITIQNQKVLFEIDESALDTQINGNEYKELKSQQEFVIIKKSSEIDSLVSNDNISDTKGESKYLALFKFGSKIAFVTCEELFEHMKSEVTLDSIVNIRLLVSLVNGVKSFIIREG